MRQIIGFIGFLFGVLAMILGLLFNPLAPPPIGADVSTDVYDWSNLEFHGAILDDVALLGLPLRMVGQPFASENVETANASIIVLRTPTGEAAALATRLSVIDSHGDLLNGDLGVQTYTNIFWPNTGSLMIYGYENRWPVVRSSFMHALAQQYDKAWLVSSQDSDGEPSGVIGGSGLFEGIGGRYSHRLQMNSSGDGTFTGQLGLELGFR